jgi:hypothetical protein
MYRFHTWSEIAMNVNMTMNHLEHSRSEGVHVVLSELSEDHLAELREEDEAISGII